MTDRFVAGVGFVVAGVALAATLLPWTAGPGLGPFASPVGAGLAGTAILGFGLHRYDVVDGRLAAGIAGLASVLLVGYAVWLLAWPALMGDGSPAAGGGLVLAIVAGGIAGMVAYADWIGLDRVAFLRRARAGSVAVGLGITGLLASNLIGLPVVLAGQSLSVVLQFGLLTVAAGAGLGVVALVFLAVTDRGWEYVDARWPDRRDALYVVAGSVVIFGLLVGLGALFEMLGLPSAEHSLVSEARQTPDLLLALIPLAWLVIGPGEELLFRNVIQKYLTGTYAQWSAVLLATGVFTLVHVVPYFTQDTLALLLTLARLFVLSLVLGVAYARTENVVVPALIHGTFDGVQFLYLYYLLSQGLI